MKNYTFLPALALLFVGTFFYAPSILTDRASSSEAPDVVEAASCDSMPLNCIPGLAVELLLVDSTGDGIPDLVQKTIPVMELLELPNDGCPGSFSVNLMGEPQNPNQDSLLLGCYELGTNEVQVWYYDTLGNVQDSCTTFIIVLDYIGFCGDGLSVQGNVNTPDGVPVPNVRVELDWREFGVDSTDATGRYSYFEGAYFGEPASIKPIREGDELNGVSTFDLVLMSKHLLGVQPFDHYTQYIAADINRSGTITLLDMIQLRRLILQQEGFDNNTSWRFIPEDQDHWGEGTILDWNNISEQIYLSDIEADIEWQSIYTVDFIAIKVGDLDGSATP
jgi:hypothetical protein